MFNVVNRAIGKRLASFLSKDLPGYQRLDTASLDEVAAALQKSDILLVEGNTRISTAIKYLTQSSWSHACLYVGNPGDGCDIPNLIEADLNHGVHMVSLDRYANLNLRICRPVGVGEEETTKLIEFAQSKLGHQYDLKNVVDLVRYVIQKPVVPNRYRRSMISLGSGEPTRAICSTLIAEAFQSIDYPILPRRDSGVGEHGEVPQYYRSHFTHFTPRDFDVSPYFKIIKPTIEGGFDYRQLNWRPSEDSSVTE